MYYRNALLNQEETSGFFFSLIVSDNYLVPQSLINTSSLSSEEMPTLLSEVIEIYAVPHSDPDKKDYYYQKNNT